MQKGAGGVELAALAGLGQLFVNGAFSRDFTLVQGTVLLYATLVVLLNLAADMALAWMNPQVRE